MVRLRPNLVVIRAPPALRPQPAFCHVLQRQYLKSQSKRTTLPCGSCTLRITIGRSAPRFEVRLRDPACLREESVLITGHRRTTSHRLVDREVGDLVAEERIELRDA